ncbi:hypothetical protein [Nitrosomonas aestuarii]|uniref:hypothetical protein n=1 Tax=Nitrosomonas aestuarii TaxID=52441 RepID=UPI000D326D9B|nr:hypothetical protein [Nitrosomonas aestuarii]PTN08433.1 hypothetical protein C8R11_12812 [Nitrosomonas aestuarii]
MKYQFILRHSVAYPIILLCTVMNVSRSAYYAWHKRPAKIITSAELHLYRRLKALFKESKNSLGGQEYPGNYVKKASTLAVIAPVH